MTIIILGVSSAIGLELLNLINKEKKYNLIGTYKDKEKLKLLKKFDYDFYKLDIQDSLDVSNFCDIIDNVKDKQIVFINLLAVSIDSLFIHLSANSWKQNMDINLNSYIPILQKTVSKMVYNRWGRVINISSVVAKSCNVGTASYACSKASVLALSKVIANEYARFNITSNSLVLGYFDKGLINKLNTQQQKEILKKIPSNRFGDIKNIFYAIDFLIKADYVNGSEIYIDGGIN